MATRNMRNIGLHTDAATVEANIVQHMKKWGMRSPERSMPASGCGYAGFPEYSFKNPQGAALAVSRILRSMVRRGVIRDFKGYWLP